MRRRRKYGKMRRRKTRKIKYKNEKKRSKKKNEEIKRKEGRGRRGRESGGSGGSRGSVVGDLVESETFLPHRMCIDHSRRSERLQERCRICLCESMLSSVSCAARRTMDDSDRIMQDAIGHLCMACPGIKLWHAIWIPVLQKRRRLEIVLHGRLRFEQE